jgi:hypothetical protein
MLELLYYIIVVPWIVGLVIVGAMIIVSGAAIIVGSPYIAFLWVCTTLVEKYGSPKLKTWWYKFTEQTQPQP